jgi:hypothetical protein
VGRLSLAAALERRGLMRAAVAARELRWHFALGRSVLGPGTALGLTKAWLRERHGRRAYHTLSEQELLATRRSDTVFVFGSGRSLVEIGREEWERMAAHDIVGFSQFHRQRDVRVDYHLIAEVLEVEDTASSIRANPRYADTIFLVMKGWIAGASNEFVGRRLLLPGARIFRWRRLARGRIVPPSRSLANGLVHGPNTSLDAVNFALLMGWSRIVVVGVDLYNKEYFWLPPGEARPDEHPGLTAASPFVGAEQIVEMYGLWRRELETEGIELSTYNRRSLLAEVLPVFAWDV